VRRHEPLLLPALCLVVGILAAHFLPPHPPLLCAWALAALCLLTLGGLLVFKQFALALSCISLLALGLLTASLHQPPKTPHLDIPDGDTALLDACVVTPPTTFEGVASFAATISRNAGVRFTVSVPDGERPAFGYGDRIEAAAKIRVPRNFGNPGAFDYAGYLAAQHIYWTASVSSFSDIQVLDHNCGNPWIGALYRLRTAALYRLHELYPDDPQTAGLLAATLLGETSGIERRWTADFRATGTYHAIVISGLHVWIVTASLLLLLRIVGIRRIHAMALCSLAAWAYAFIAGFNAPVVRAAAAFSLFFVANLLFRRTRLLNVLAAVAIVYLLMMPVELFDPGFQLSFLSAAAIGLFAIPFIERFIEPWREAVRRFDQVRFDPAVSHRAAPWRVEFRLLADTLRFWSSLPAAWCQRIVVVAVCALVFVTEAVVLTACVQFALALPMITYFHRLSATGISSNVLVVPVLSVMIPTGFAAMFTDSTWLAAVTKALLQLADILTSWHMRWEPSWRIAGVPLLPACLFVAALVLLAVAIRHWRFAIVPALTVALFLFALMIAQPWATLRKAGSLEVSAIDVGQGDSILVVFPNGETMLVDAGGFPGMERMKHKPQLDIGEDVVSPYLWSRRIHRLDYAVLSHGHSDHAAGLAAILDNFHPKQLWVGPEPDSAVWRQVRDHCSLNKVELRQLSRCTPKQTIGGVAVEVLAPFPDYQPGTKPGNNDSLVLRLVWKSHSVLLEGDAERPVEDELVQDQLLTPATLLKVGHHGSRTSSSAPFLEAVRPQVAFVSDGYQNQFHHPHPDVLQRFEDLRSNLLRTDEHGLLTFLSDGTSVTVTTFR
jgi:competence protein ComEC